MSKLKTKFNESNFLLAASLAISERFDFKRQNLSSLSESVEFITFVQSNGPFTNGFSLADAKRSLSSIEYKLDALIESGVSPSKIVMGLDLMGFGFTAISEENDEDGIFDRIYRFNEVCGMQLSDPRRWTNTYADTSLSILKNTEENRAIVIESSRSIANKVRLALKFGVAGVAPTSIAFDEFYGLRKIDQDTFDDFEVADGVVLNFPQRTVRQFPILITINEATRVTLDEIMQETKLSITTPRIRTTTTQRTTTTTSTTTSPTIYPDATMGTRISPKDVKIVCQVYTQSDLDARNIKFDYKKVDWNLCTHVISVDEAGGGIKLKAFFFRNFFFISFIFYVLLITFMLNRTMELKK